MLVYPMSLVFQVTGVFMPVLMAGEMGVVGVVVSWLVVVYVGVSDEFSVWIVTGKH